MPRLDAEREVGRLEAAIILGAQANSVTPRPGFTRKSHGMSDSLLLFVLFNLK
jgi:hypothetical protein